MNELNGRAYARIIQRKKRLGLLLVNQNQQSFFIYAEYLIALMRSEDNLTLIKKRDRDPEKAIAHHGGAIFAHWNKIAASAQDQEEPEALTLTFHLGELERKVEYIKETGEIRNIIETQEYLFPYDEWATLLDSIKKMLEQQQRFDRLLFEAETNPGPALLELDQI